MGGTMAKQKLILLFDGTWNDPEDQTNVYRITRLLHDDDDGIRQRFYYDPGVGTSKFQRFFGGAFGYGLSKNLREGYDWLARRYSEGDEIWIFGFSRGAYTARSLVGMIRKCGLVHVVTPGLLDKAESIYRNRDWHPDSEVCTEFKERFSRQPRIHFIGVWDTVGALGVPEPACSKADTIGTIPSFPALSIMPIKRSRWTNTGRRITYRSGQARMASRKQAIAT